VNATLFNNTSAFFLPLLMWGVFSEKISLRTLLTAIFGFSGCILLAGESFTISLNNLIGDLVALLSGLMVTSYVIVVKRIRARLSAGLVMFWTGVISLLGMGIFGLVFGESFYPFTRNDWISLFGQAILVHSLGQGCLAYSFGKISASYGALIMLLAPVTAAILGWTIYGETLSVTKVIGIVIIMTSIIVVRRA
jgi:drug/metabolite transporter (DMT)-like permease